MDNYLHVIILLTRGWLLFPYLHKLIKTMNACNCNNEKFLNLISPILLQSEMNELNKMKCPKIISISYSLDQVTSLIIRPFFKYRDMKKTIFLLWFTFKSHFQATLNIYKIDTNKDNGIKKLRCKCMVFRIKRNL